MYDYNRVSVEENPTRNRTTRERANLHLLEGSFWRDGNGEILIFAQVGAGLFDFISICSGNRHGGGRPQGSEFEEFEEFTRIKGGSTITVNVED